MNLLVKDSSRSASLVAGTAMKTGPSEKLAAALVQELRAGSRFSVIPIKPEHDKMTRMSIQSGNA
jgi:hypothetical protein